MIQIHGKRKRRPESKDSHGKRPRGRPLLGPSEEKKSTILGKLQHYHSENERRANERASRLSRLEQLPVELIQQIFFYALEVNLPRTSTHLQQALSTNAIFNALVLLAYFDDDGESPVETKHFLPSEYRALTTLEKVHLQKSILSCRWCTYDRVISCLPALSRLATVQAWYKEKAQDESQDYSEQSELAILPSLEDEAKLEEHFLARRRSIDNPGSSNITHELRINTWEPLLDSDGNTYKIRNKPITVLAVRHIPSWILSQGSLTGKKLAFLQLLRQGYTHLQSDHVISISAKAVFDGMRNAIEERNTIGLKTLVELHNTFSILHPTFDGTPKRWTPPTGHSLPLDLFHRVTRQEKASSELMALLVRAGLDALPQNDKVVTAWAVHRAQNDDALAKWLLKYMDGSLDSLPLLRLAASSFMVRMWHTIIDTHVKNHYCRALRLLSN